MGGKKEEEELLWKAERAASCGLDYFGLSLKAWLESGGASRHGHFSSFPFFSGFCFRNPGFFRTISGDGGQTTCRCEETEEEKTKISKTTGFFKKKLKTRATSDAARRASRAKTRPESDDEKQARRDARR